MKMYGEGQECDVLCRCARNAADLSGVRPSRLPLGSHEKRSEFCQKDSFFASTSTICRSLGSAVSRDLSALAVVLGDEWKGIKVRDGPLNIHRED